MCSLTPVFYVPLLIYQDGDYDNPQLNPQHPACSNDSSTLYMRLIPKNLDQSSNVCSHERFVISLLHRPVPQGSVSQGRG